MSVIDDYLQKVTPTQKAALERVRTIAKQVVPDAEETISYGVPTLKYKGKHLIYFAAFKHHMSIFPGSNLTKSLAAKLVGYKVFKGTIQFTEDKPVPEAVIKEIVTSRLKGINKPRS